jgi:hypothetical protein
LHFKGVLKDEEHHDGSPILLRHLGTELQTVVLQKDQVPENTRYCCVHLGTKCCIARRRVFRGRTPTVPRRAVAVVVS